MIGDNTHRSDVKTCFIINPRAGRRGNRTDVMKRAEAFLSVRGNEGRVMMTERPAHARELARSAVGEGFDQVVAVGGDGTMNEVASVLIGTRVAMGLVPRGSGNGLGRHLGIRHGDSHAFEVLQSGRILAIDTGVVNGVPFINAMGIGFDAEVSQRFNALTKRGFVSYLSTAVRLFLSHKAVGCTVRAEGARFSENAFLVAVANSDQYGNDCIIAPGARLDDGLLDLTLIRDVGWLRAPGLGMRLFTRTLDRSPLVVRSRAAAFVIERMEDGVVHTDGEVHHMGRRLDIVVRPASLRVMVPSDWNR